MLLFYLFHYLFGNFVWVCMLVCICGYAHRGQSTTLVSDWISFHAKTGSLTGPGAHQLSYTVRHASCRDPPSSASPALGVNQLFTQTWTPGLMQQALYVLRHCCSPRWSSLMIAKDRTMKRKIHFRMQKSWAWLGSVYFVMSLWV